ncbi:hypothetical protein AO398_19730 [Methylobacterium sp. GXS13]|uniref:DUF6894 family protein n=1 Tax=unclassified Methylobacterium TaxID=2615210 RepID=UPI00071BCD83|nr:MULTISPECIES: hypothetical protein [unclassified Methylobacterium]KST58960.1 hypothetical protein AO398_19730 [Methylobacterium sp. GXS13]MCJ2119191.1 hypothetical protein [Methylobacterium sp. J-001]
MPERFYFDIENGRESIRDEEGVEADSLETALAEARSVIREMADELAASDPDAIWTLVVRDASGSAVGRLPIKP